MAEPLKVQRVEVSFVGAAPVLQVGDKLVAKGYNEARWQSLLGEASPGCPTPARAQGPSPRRSSGARPAEPTG